MNYLIILGAGAALAVPGYLLLKREQRRSTKRVLLLARIAKYKPRRPGAGPRGITPGPLLILVIDMEIPKDLCQCGCGQKTKMGALSAER